MNRMDYNITYMENNRFHINTNNNDNIVITLMYLLFLKSLSEHVL